MKKLATGVLVGFLLCMLFSAPWMYQAWAVGNCSVFRTWNTGDSVTASDLNSSFTTAAVTNSTPSCVDDYSATVTQMQTSTDPYASGTESQATSLAGEIERIRYVLKTSLGMTHWYRHDQAPAFGSLTGHVVLGSLHLGSVSHSDLYASRFPVLTGPDHWTGIWWPAGHAHMAFSFRDGNHAGAGTKGGIELYRFHAEALTLHHTVTLRFRHSAMNGSFPHVTAVAIDGQDRLVFGHSGVALILHGTGLTAEGAHHKALFISYTGHVYSNSVRPDSWPISLYIQIFN